ncbi:MAG TPA: enoyl-CoA hydratase/isomerase family protein [Bryobacteraceae bacterium]|nr:enoyl-CoA hydratase/isomerase family protein [Bryobacteraceae bacterium]
MKLILYQVEQGIARITLNRPEKRNALNPELISALKKAVQDSDRLILLSGAGSDFCSGADLSGLHNMAEANVLDHLASAREMADLFIAMRRHPHPIIAAVRGRALAGGCGLATAADIILASESAQFGYPEVYIGFVPAMVMAILRRCVSEKRAFELIATGDVISAQTAFDYGLVNRVFADETFDVDVHAFTSKLASKSQSALMLSKQLLYHIDNISYEAAIEAGIQVNAIARSTDDCKRGIERFLKKTT